MVDYSEYKVVFEVDSCFSYKSGVKEPTTHRSEQKILVEEGSGIEDVLISAAQLGNRLSLDALPNPLTKVSKVTLLSIVGPGGEIDQTGFLSTYSSVESQYGDFTLGDENGKMVFTDCADLKYHRSRN